MTSFHVKSLLMTKNHHNDVYNTAKTSQFTRTINAYLMISTFMEMFESLRRFMFLAEKNLLHCDGGFKISQIKIFCLLWIFSSMLIFEI